LPCALQVNMTVRISAPAMWGGKNGTPKRVGRSRLEGGGGGPVFSPYSDSEGFVKILCLFNMLLISLHHAVTTRMRTP
jgi:hypothetical protein